MNRLRIAVIGAGHLGRIHTRLLKTHDDAELVGVVDPVATARHAAAAEFQIATYADHRELSRQIDAAVIATPTQYHHAVSLDLLRQGVHLLVEKPLVPTVAEADELIAAADSRGLILQVGHVEQFNPALTAVRPLIHAPRYIEAVRASGYSFRSTDIGVVLDLMIHDLDIALTLANDEVVDVQALGVAIFGGHEDLAQARIQFAGGCVANLSASRSSFAAQRTMRVFCERIYAGLDFASGTVKTVRPAEKLLRGEIDFDRLSPEEKRRVQETLFSDLLPVEDLATTPTNAILDEQREFIHSIRTGRAPRVSGAHARRTLAVAEQILAKIAAHRWSDEDAARENAARPTTPVVPKPHFHSATAPHQRRAG